VILSGVGKVGRDGGARKDGDATTSLASKKFTSKRGGEVSNLKGKRKEGGEGGPPGPERGCLRLKSAGEVPNYGMQSAGRGEAKCRAKKGKPPGRQLAKRGRLHSMDLKIHGGLERARTERGESREQGDLGILRKKKLNRKEDVTSDDTWGKGPQQRESKVLPRVRKKIGRRSVDPETWSTKFLVN